MNAPQNAKNQHGPFKPASLLFLLALALTTCGRPAATETHPNNPKPDFTNLTYNFDRTQDEGPIPSPEPDTRDQISDIVRRIYQDSKGNFWFGTNSHGVFRYNGDTLQQFSEAQGLAGYQVTGIIEDHNGSLWLSTNGGISHYEDNTFTNYTTQDGLPSNSVWSIFEDSKGNLWAGTREGLCRLNGKTFIPFPLPPSPIKKPSAHLSPKLVWCITEDKKGNLWFGTDGNGVAVHDGKNFHCITQEEGLCENSITCIRIDQQGHIWFSSMTGGLTYYDGTTSTTINSENYIGDNEVWTIFEDRSGNIWFPSEGFGVYRYAPSLSPKPDTKSITNFSKSHGLNILAVQTIIQDKSGHLWFGGGGGVYRYDGNAFVNITKNGPWQ